MTFNLSNLELQSTAKGGDLARRDPMASCSFGSHRNEFIPAAGAISGNRSFLL